MMNPAFLDIIAATDAERRDLFVATATRLGTTVQNIEKDFWVCWTLDAMFNGLDPSGPRFLFKGGTSLSKGYGLISRFSEDIDITVFRADLGEPITVEALAALSGKKREASLNAIKTACQTYINGRLLGELTATAADTMNRAGKGTDAIRIELDADDRDGQSLLLWYPTVTADVDSTYMRPAVKIESGAKSALDPHSPIVVKPYVADDLSSSVDLSVPNVTTVDPTRTFWDKIVILHGLRRWYDRRGELRGGGNRVSRHYYDVYRLLEARVGRLASADMQLAADCVDHARMFFNRPDFDLATAARGTLALAPHDDMVRELRRDYAAMSTMIFGAVPAFDDVMAAIAHLEFILNSPHSGAPSAAGENGPPDSVRPHQHWRGVDPLTGNPDAVAVVYNVLGDQVEVIFEDSGARHTVSAARMIGGYDNWRFIANA